MGFFFFFHEKISHAQKAQKAQRRKTSDFHSDVFYTHKKHKKYKT